MLDILKPIDYNEFVNKINDSNIDTRLVFMISLIAIAVSIGFLIYYNTNSRD